MIRCFISVEIPSIILAQIEEYIAQLRLHAPNIKWVRAAGIHITLKFLGEISENRVEQVRDKLAPICITHKIFNLTAQGSGFFPSKNKPRVVWIGLDQDRERSLYKLHQWIDDVMETLNFQREKRRFSPHITLGRIKNLGNFSELYSYLDKNPFPATSFSVDSVKLMRSILKPEGAKYSVIESYPLVS
jgi:2'-5' RNA ligase